MALRKKIKLMSVNGVAAGQTATVDLPTGRRYFRVHLYYKTNANQATIEADITEIRIVVNGVVQRRFSSADLFVVNALNGITFVNGLIPIHFAEPWRRTITGEEGLAWGTANVSTFQIQVDIAAGAVAPTLIGVAEVDNVAVPLAGIIKWYKETFNSAGAQTLTITTLPKLDAYLRIHARSALVTAAKVVTDSIEIYDVTRDQANAMMSAQKLTAQANNYHLIFDDDQQVTSARPMVKAIDGGGFKTLDEFRVDLTCSAAGAIPLLIERFGNPD